MRIYVVPLMIAALCLPVFAQRPVGRRVQPPIPSSGQATLAEGIVKQAMEQLAAEKKAYDRDLEVLQHLRDADVALTDPMQPYNAIEKAFGEVDKVKSIVSDPAVSEGVGKVAQQLEDARRSPTTADFGRLRATLRVQALGPAIRLVARNGAKLQDDTLSWLRVQELISSHLRALAEITSASLRAAQQ